MDNNERWTQLQDGGSDIWQWVANDGLVFVFVEVIDLIAHCGRDASSVWSANVAVVDLSRVSFQTVVEACNCYGVELVDSFDLSTAAQVLYDYGSRAPLWSKDAGEVYASVVCDECDAVVACVVDHHARCECGSTVYADGLDVEDNKDFQQLKRDAFAEANMLLRDRAYRDHSIDTTVVNALGQTAREFADGANGLWRALRRIRDDPNSTDDQKLVLKMYRNAGQTLGCGPVPGDLL